MDDEAHLRMLIQQTLEELEDEGVELLTASNGEEALATIESVEAEPGVPRRDDAEAEWLRRLQPRPSRTLGLKDVYIVLLTAKGQEFDRQRGQEVGADLYMTKPFDPDALLQKARDVLGRVMATMVASRLQPDRSGGSRTRVRWSSPIADALGAR